MSKVYGFITDRIIKELEAGVVPWQKPWVGGGKAVSYVTGKPYSLLNQMLVGDPGEYITFKQVQELGGKVKKGSKSRMLVWYKPKQKPVLDENGNQKVDKNGEPVFTSFPLIQYYNVFNIQDCEGIPPKWQADLDKMQDKAPIEQAEELIDGYIGNSGIRLLVDFHNVACYSPSDDEIMLPTLKQFATPEEYYSTAFHEMIHSTEHEKRLGRFKEDEAVGMLARESYSKEELVAEVGAAVLMNKQGIDTEKAFKNSAAYLASWLEVFKGDNRFIVEAMSRAEKAVAFIEETAAGKSEDDDESEAA